LVVKARPRLGYDFAVLAPNLLTFARVLSVPVIVYDLLAGGSGLTLYLFACISDLLDGALARRLSGETRVGSTFDACADFLLVFGVSATLYQRGLLPIWFLILIALTFAQFLFVKPRSGSDPLGKHIGTILFIALGAILFQPAPWVALWSTLLSFGYIVASLSVRWVRTDSNRPTPSS
jgi:phosphatidylglycerophosphate synthase